MVLYGEAITAVNLLHESSMWPPSTECKLTLVCSTDTVHLVHCAVTKRRVSLKYHGGKSYYVDPVERILSGVGLIT